jgi:hypothetical protein
MPSRWKYVAGTLALLTMAYALVVAGQILLGLIVSVGIYGTAWLFAVFRPDEGYIAALGPARAAVLTLLALANLLYAVVIAGQLLLGVIAVWVIALVGVVLTPGGPLTRAREFFERLERVDRYIREHESELTDGGWNDDSDATPTSGARPTTPTTKSAGSATARTDRRRT